ncbi:GroES-like protein [Thozetella sp. PMI_491]|nr:GroES-like protein [Thozetella sp. PMI_491]
MPAVLLGTEAVPLLQTAVVQDADGRPRVAHDAPVPTLSAGDVLVQTAMVALIPCDYKMGATFPTPGSVVGNDFVGTVVRIHEGTETALQVGDTVCGVVHGSNPADKTNGAFAQYICASADLLLRVPAGFKLEQAATLGSPLATASIALWEGGLELEASPDEPASEPFPVLVYGASTTTGTMALQLLRLSGARTIATCSRHSFDLVRSFGADVILDYTDPDTPARIKEETGGELEHALDIITDPDSVACCYAALSRFGGQYASLELCPKELQTRRAVEAKFALGLEVFGREVELSKGYERAANQEARDAAVRRFKTFQACLDAGKLKPHPVKVLPAGFDEVIKGLKMLKSGSVSGCRLVVPLY